MAAIKRKLFLFLLIFTIAGTELCFARAGGGGAETVVGGGILMTILAFILAPFFFIYSLVMTFLWKRKGRRAERLANRLSDSDKMWNLHDMKARVEMAFFKVQRAWMERDQDMAREFMSDRIYEKHKMQTDAMISAGTKNMLENVNLLSIMITSVEDYQDNSRDAFVALVKGRMIDYHINEKSKAVTKGNPSKAEDFEELWKFIRKDNAWLLDEIDQSVNKDDLGYSRAYTQK